MKKRGFEVVSKYADQQLTLPYRSTKQAAGYDFECATDTVVPSIWKLGFLRALHLIRHQKPLDGDKLKSAQADLKPRLVSTGIKAYMQPDEVLLLVNRSSGPLKHSLVLPNGIGVIDADYYNNAANEGEIFIQLMNFGLTDRVIKKGTRIGQGIFMPYLSADAERMPQAVRSGGFGSSDKKS
ncbi:dUTP diphosphatase [Levilactobacillus bambusae]|uniref:dUTP diphosphatase n=1 Tax=Levilactobacillus bambusae TaxID=2024736 RepID=A0A2V1MYZ2_9LACO|nr:dUTP diphosphatase [Levilactobacillus bambusae]PWF99365.1 dUTP diphosphatase [Levilactobacillus bambusae]